MDKNQLLKQSQLVVKAHGMLGKTVTNGYDKGVVMDWRLKKFSDFTEVQIQIKTEYGTNWWGVRKFEII